MDAISCRGVVKKFGNFTALNKVSINVPEASIFGLLGPNGAGKTTLIRIINQITIPDAGEIFFNGRLSKPNDVYSIGYLPEERGLYKKLKVGEQAMYLARLKGMSSSEAMRELKKWFVKFGIESWWNKKVDELSKGMAQKIQFITTVVHRPKLIILDEPFSGFDPINVELIRKEIINLKDRGTTIILSTHNMESVEKMCDSIALINKSNLVVTGNIDDIRNRYGKNQIEVIYRSSEKADIESDSFSISLDDTFKGNRRAVLDVADGTPSPKILADISASGIDVVSYRELIPSMNDIFIKLVKGEDR